MIYLATPYSHKVRDVMVARFEFSSVVAYWLMTQGDIVFAPISHSHPINELVHSNPTWEFWAKQDLGILRHCERLKVLTLPGWEKSVGVQAELNFARECGIGIGYIKPESVVNDIKRSQHFSERVKSEIDDLWLRASR